MRELVRAQWDQLLAWLVEVDAEGRAGLPSGLDGWTVGDLVAHVGLGIGMVAEVRAAPPGTTPVGVGAYVGQYRAAATVIDWETRELRQRLEPRLLEGIDALARESWASLEAHGAEVVLGRRGAVTLDDYLLTRLVELVVHADDLERALGSRVTSPVRDDALLVVADALSAVHLELRGTRPVVTDPLTWVREASGRQPAPDGAPPLLG